MKFLNFEYKYILPLILSVSLFVIILLNSVPNKKIADSTLVNTESFITKERINIDELNISIEKPDILPVLNYESQIVHGDGWGEEIFRIRVFYFYVLSDNNLYCYLGSADMPYKMDIENGKYSNLTIEELKKYTENKVSTLPVAKEFEHNYFVFYPLDRPCDSTKFSIEEISNMRKALWEVISTAELI